jgi:glycoprotein endo-alpha-1,2-mannosidase
MRPFLACSALVGLVALLGPAAAWARPSGFEPAVRSAIFYYAWYGTPKKDGDFRHWQQNGAEPPRRIASAYYPARGAYSSADALVVSAQMQEIAAAGVDQVVISWWGRGSAEDVRFGSVARAARAAGLKPAAHIEPYGDRDPDSVGQDIAYLRAYGVSDVYVFGAADRPGSDWAAMNDRVAPPVRVFAQTGQVGVAAAGRFDGVYTYDIVTWNGAKFRRICGQAQAAGLLCAPSVGPGFDARRAAGVLQLKPRADGSTYDRMWSAALRSRPELVTITSYNEWHEGTQIEPARARPGYASYDGAWGRRGAGAERAYLDRTALWVARLEQRGR